MLCRYLQTHQKKVGRSLKRAHCKGNLVNSRKQVAYKPFGTKGGLSGPKRVPRPLFKQHNPGSHRQYNSGCLYQQRRGDEVGLTVCPTVENPVLVHQETGNSQSTSHPRPAERDSRQAVQAWPDHSNGMVPSSRGVPSYMLPVASASSGSFCHQIQQQTTTVCLTSPRPPGMGSGCTRSVLGGPGPICLSTSSHLGQSSGEVTGLPFNQTLHRNLSNLNLHAWLLEPQQSRSRDSLRQWQQELRLLKEDQPDLSVYEAKWTIFTKWCLNNQVDFRAPPLKAIADFVLHLFQDRKLQPGTIDGYRLAIADKLGNPPLMSAKMRTSLVF